MYLGYCFDENGNHTPASKLETPLLAFNYCFHWHHDWPEIRITDLDDYCVMHVINHQMKIPWEDGTFRHIDLNNSVALDTLLKMIESESAG